MSTSERSIRYHIKVAAENLSGEISKLLAQLEKCERQRKKSCTKMWSRGTKPGLAMHFLGTLRFSGKINEIRMKWTYCKWKIFVKVYTDFIVTKITVNWKLPITEQRNNVKAAIGLPIVAEQLYRQVTCNQFTVTKGWH